MGERLRNLQAKQVILVTCLLVAAGWSIGWRCFLRPTLAQVPIMLPDDYETTEARQACPGLDEALDLLNAGQYLDALARLDALVPEPATQPTVLRYKALAQFAAGRTSEARKTADAALVEGATGPDATIALSLKALGALDHPEIARPLAEQAIRAADSASQAGLVAQVAYAAVVRAEHDVSSEAVGAADLALVTEQAFLPILYAVPTEPSSAWQARFWRHGLALLADGYVLAGEAGDANSELAAMALLQRSCPDDAWNCYFGIPDRARLAAQGNDPVLEQLDDHVRVAMLTATGFLHIGSGDRYHGDVLYRKAIEAYGRLLEDFDEWDGEIMLTITPQGQSKFVGNEFYTYRNRMERLAKYSADFWGIRVVRGQASMEEALAKTDQRLFRAMVRVRADAQTDPVQILREERIHPWLYSTVADWFAKRPYAPQADFEVDRATLMARIGREEVEASETMNSARDLLQAGRREEALSLLTRGLDTEPSLSETRVSMRCEMARVLMRLGRYGEALNILYEAERDLETGDAHPAFGRDGLRGRIGYYRMMIARRTGDIPEAIRLAGLLFDDDSLQLSLRARTLLDLVQMHIEQSERSQALDTYERLAGLSVTPAEWELFLQPVLRAAESRLVQRGWLELSQVAAKTANGHAGELSATADAED